MKANSNLSLAGIAPMASHAGRSAGRRVSNLTTATRESSAQPRSQQTFRANLHKPGLLHPAPSAAILPQPAPFRTGRQMPARMFSVRVGAANRDYRRAVLAAEMTAWNTASPSDTTLLRAEKIERKSRAEEFAFNAILALALAGVVWGLADSEPLTSGLQSFVSLVRQWVG